MERRDYIGIGVLLAMVIAVPFLVDNPYYLGVLVFTALNCLTCIGLSLLMGYAGQISLGHAAFIALGAYSSALLTTLAGWSPWAAMGAGAVISAVVAVIVGVPSLRLKGHYLAMATLGFSAIVHIVAIAAVDITGGPQGIGGIPYLSFGDLVLDTDIRFYYFSWAVVIIGLILALNLIHSRMGRGLRAIHGSEDAACAAGVHTALYKIQIFIISAVYASISGSLYASYATYIDPGPFDVMHSVLLVTMVAVGGMHRLWGAVIGAVLLSLLPEILSSFSGYFQMIGLDYSQDYDILIYGGILLAIMLFLPEGLFSGGRSLFRYLYQKFSPAEEEG